MERGEDVGALGYFEPDVAENGGCGVAAGEEDVEEFGAEAEGGWWG